MERRIFLKGIVGGFLAGYLRFPHNVLPSTPTPTKHTRHTIYIGLCTKDGEVSNPEYKRVEIPPEDWERIDWDSVTNRREIKWPEATSSWGTITDFILCDSVTGMVITDGFLKRTHGVHPGDVVSFPIEAITIEL